MTWPPSRNETSNRTSLASSALAFLVVDLADGASDALRRLEQGRRGHQRLGLAGFGIFPALAQHAHDRLADRQVAGGRDRHDALAGLGEDMQLAERRDVVDAGIGAGVGEHHQAVTNQNSAAIGHELARSPDREALIAIPAGRASNRRISSAIWRCGLVDMDIDRQRLAGAAVAGAADRRRAQIVEPGRNPDMGVGGADPIGGVECHPAEIGHEGLGPGVAGVLIDDAVVAMEIAADVARRNADAARGGDEDVGEVLAHAALEGECFGGRGGGMGGVGVEGDVAVQPLQQVVQELELVVAGGRARGGGKAGDRVVGPGQRRLAQEQRRRKPLDRAGHDAVGVAGLDLAVDRRRRAR